MTDSADDVRVTGINVYPIKSTAGIAVDASSVEAQGLAMDRRWMVVDENGGCLTGREYPILTQIRSRLDEEGLSITAPGADEIPIPVPAESAPVKIVTVWGDECRTLSADAAVDRWFTELLDTRCHLVYMGDARQRPVNIDYSRTGDSVSFADGYPLLLISEASLADLNTRLSESVTMGRFRPNVVVGGCEAYAEDGWRAIGVGETRFDGAENCPRCVFTTIDPDNGARHPRQEPLRTLGGYRRAADGGVLFGQTLIPRRMGTIRVGDVVTVGDHSA